MNSVHEFMNQAFYHLKSSNQLQKHSKIDSGRDVK